MQLLGTLLPLAFGGGPPRPLPASVYLSVQQSSAWERTIIDELAWAQSFLLPLSQPPLAQASEAAACASWLLP